MNGVLLVAGIIFLMMGIPLALFSPTIVHGFYESTGLDNISIYQNEKAIADVIGMSRLMGLELLAAGAIFIPLSRYM